jgi:hypothetical protein
MSKLSELHADLETIRRIMDDDMGDEPQTPKEIAEHKVAMAVRDCWLASAEIFKLHCDPIAAPFLTKAEGDLWSIKSRVDQVISEIRLANGEFELPKLRVAR